MAKMDMTTVCTTTDSSGETYAMKVSLTVDGTFIECQRCKTMWHQKEGHSDQYCSLIYFRKFDAEKYGMVSIFDDLTETFHFNYVSGNLKNIYPKIASKSVSIANAGHGIPRYSDSDIFVEAWAADAIRLFIKNDGFAGMTLADFLDKTATDRHAIKPPSDI